MPTPVAHSIISLSLSNKKPAGSSVFKWLAFWVVLGNFADFDFLPGIMIGDPNRYHHGLSHSILFAIVLAITAYLLYPSFFKERRAPFRTYLSVTLCHLFLDLLTVDRVWPCGLPLFWPFSHTYYISPFSIFLNVNRGMCLHVLLTWHNLMAIALELAISLPLLTGVLIWKNRVRIRDIFSHIARPGLR